MPHTSTSSLRQTINALLSRNVRNSPCVRPEKHHRTLESLEQWQVPLAYVLPKLQYFQIANSQ